jgi:hypothetical protein
MARKEKFTTIFRGVKRTAGSRAPKGLTTERTGEILVRGDQKKSLFFARF